MSSDQIDEAAILRVASEIGNPKIRALYFGQVCQDLELGRQLEQRVRLRRRWQFGLRGLLVFMVLAAVASAFLGITVNSAIQAQRIAEQARLQEIRALKQARGAMLQAQAAQAKEDTQ